MKTYADNLSTPKLQCVEQEQWEEDWRQSMKLKNDDGDGKLRILKTSKDINLKKWRNQYKEANQRSKEDGPETRILRILRTYGDKSKN